MRNSLLIISFVAVIAAIILIPTMGSDDGNKDFVIIHTSDSP